MTETGLMKVEDVNALQPTFDPSERPDFIPKGDKTGTEGITAEDIKLPRLLFAQAMSPEMIPGNTKYIRGLTLFQMFNDFSKEVYGTGPVFFVPVRRDVRYIEFKPRSEGGGVIDLNVPVRDPRTRWTNNADGTRTPPRATKFSEFVVLVIKNGNMTDPVVLSIKDTNKWNRAAAYELTSRIKFFASQGDQSVPIYGVIYAIESKPETNDKGTFATPVVTPRGFIPKSMPWLFDRAREYAASLEGREIVIDRDDLDPEDVVDAEPDM